MTRYIRAYFLGFVVLLSIVFTSSVDGQVVPISFSEIITALKAKLPPGATKSQLIKFLIADVSKRKVDERLVDQQEDKLREAGATQGLIAAIRENLVGPPDIQSDFITPRFSEGAPISMRDPDGTQRIGLLVDKFESVGDGELSARIDSLYARLNSDPDETAAIVTYGAENEMNRRFAKIRNAINLRKYDPGRTHFLRGVSRPTILTAIYIIPDASKKQPPDSVPTPKEQTPIPVTTGTPTVTKVDPLKILSQPRPSYTSDARQNGIEGTVTLKVTFLDSGLIGPIEVVSGLANGLTEMAVEAAKHIKFIPASVAGKPISVTKELIYTFKLY